MNWGACLRPAAELRRLLCMRALARAKPHPGRLLRFTSAVAAARRLPCASRSRGLSPNSLRSLRSLRSNKRRQVSCGCALRARPHALRCSAPPRRCAACPGAPLQPPWRVFGEQQHPWPSRQALPGGSDLGGDEQASPDGNSPVDCFCLASGRAFGPARPAQARAGVGARAARASTTDSPRLFERSERSERSEFCGATPDRAAQ